MHMDVGSRLVFTGYACEASDDPIFRIGCFGVVGSLDAEGIPTCYLTDEAGKVLWWRPETLFPEEFIHLSYAPKISLGRIPAPHGTLIGQPV